MYDSIIYDILLKKEKVFGYWFKILLKIPFKIYYFLSYFIIIM